MQFQSTLPCRERLQTFIDDCCVVGDFNPRSHVGSDSRKGTDYNMPTQFQSTLPCRERLLGYSCRAEVFKFQSTLPCRERQYFYDKRALANGFQSTLPCRERLEEKGLITIEYRFQSTLPCRERHARPFVRPTKINFNPRSHVGSDCQSLYYPGANSDFNPRSHVGSDSIGYSLTGSTEISIHAPM